MKNALVIGIILLVLGANGLPSIVVKCSDITNKVIQEYQLSPLDMVIPDWTNDVMSMDPATQERLIVITHPDIDIENIDITKAIYSQQGVQATLTVQVSGVIENRNKPENTNGTNADFVFYFLELVTSDHYYLVEYCNLSGRLHRGNETINLTSSYFSVVNDTLIITFSLFSDDETYKSLKVGSIFRKTDVSGDIIANLYDRVPNYFLKVFLFGKINIIATGEDHIMVEAENLWIFHGFLSFDHYDEAEKIIISDQYTVRVLANHFLIGFFNVLV